MKKDVLNVKNYQEKFVADNQNKFSFLIEQTLSEKSEFFLSNISS
jgi:hypothetical protein